MTLRQLIESHKDNQFYIENYENIRFEINHLELHGIDNYLLNLYNNDVKGLPNKNNSNIAYLIGLTSEKPTKRITTVGGGFPDIDSDFEKNQRNQVFEYLKNKYGDGFAHIGTATYTAGKSVYKAAARIHGVSFAEANKVASYMPDIECPRLEDLINQNKEINKLYKNNPEFKEVWDDAISLQDCCSSLGIHAAGVVISDDPLYEHIPLWDSKGEPVTQYDGSVIESTGCIKLDILGLNTLTVLKDAAKLVKKNHGIDIDYWSLPLDDKATYESIGNTNNLGVFQIEGAGISSFANACQPKNIHDIAIIVATYRPGPMGLPGLLSRVAGKIRGDIEYTQFQFPKYDYIFKNSYGELIFQESFLRLSMDMCGFTEIEADKLRKAVGDI